MRTISDSISNSFFTTMVIFALASGCGATAQFAGDEQRPTVSGSTNTTNTPQTISVDGDAYGVSSLAWAEGGTGGGLNKPCFLRVEFRNLSDALKSSGNDTVFRELNVCNNENYNNGSLLEPTGPGVPSDPRLPIFVDGIQTCDSKSNDNERVKGIKIWRSLVNDAPLNPAEFQCSVGSGGSGATGTCEDIAGPNAAEAIKVRSADRPNCGDWNDRSDCDGGKIASGVRVYTSTAGEIIGLGLVCETVEFEEN